MENMSGSGKIASKWRRSWTCILSPFLAVIGWFILVIFAFSVVPDYWTPCPPMFLLLSKLFLPFALYSPLVIRRWPLVCQIFSVFSFVRRLWFVPLFRLDVRVMNSYKSFGVHFRKLCNEPPKSILPSLALIWVSLKWACSSLEIKN